MHGAPAPLIHPLSLFLFWVFDQSDCLRPASDSFVDLSIYSLPKYVSFVVWAFFLPRLGPTFVQYSGGRSGQAKKWARELVGLQRLDSLDLHKETEIGWKDRLEEGEKDAPEHALKELEGIYLL